MLGGVGQWCHMPPPPLSKGCAKLCFCTLPTFLANNLEIAEIWLWRRKCTVKLKISGFETKLRFFCLSVFGNKVKLKIICCKSFNSFCKIINDFDCFPFCHHKINQIIDLNYFNTFHKMRIAFAYWYLRKILIAL